MANLSAAVEYSRVVIFADNNAHPNPASLLKSEVLGIGLKGKGWGWLDWAGFGVEQYWHNYYLHFVHIYVFICIYAV